LVNVKLQKTKDFHAKQAKRILNDIVKRCFKQRSNYLLRILLHSEIVKGIQNVATLDKPVLIDAVVVGGPLVVKKHPNKK